MRIDVVTLFPRLVAAVVECGVTGRAVERGLIKVKTWNPREYALVRIAASMTVPTVAGQAWS